MADRSIISILIAVGAALTSGCGAPSGVAVPVDGGSLNDNVSDPVNTNGGGQTPVNANQNVSIPPNVNDNTPADPGDPGDPNGDDANDNFDSDPPFEDACEGVTNRNFQIADRTLAFSGSLFSWITSGGQVVGVFSCDGFDLLAVASTGEQFVGRYDPRADALTWQGTIYLPAGP